MTLEEFKKLSKEDISNLTDEQKIDIGAMIKDIALSKIYEENINYLDGTIRWKNIDVVTASVAMKLLHEGWVISQPFGFVDHHKGKKIEQFDDDRKLIYVDEAWHNIFDLLNIGYTIAPL